MLVRSGSPTSMFETPTQAPKDNTFCQQAEADSTFYVHVWLKGIPKQFRNHKIPFLISGKCSQSSAKKYNDHPALTSWIYHASGLMLKCQTPNLLVHHWPNLPNLPGRPWNTGYGKWSAYSGNAFETLAAIWHVNGIKGLNYVWPFGIWKLTCVSS